MAPAPPGPSPAGPSDPFALMRTKRYAALLVIAAILGVPIATAAYWFLKLTTDMQTWVYSDLPDAVGFDGQPAWWPLLTLGAAGVVVGATIRYLPGRGGEVPVEGFKPGTIARPVQLPGIAIAAITSIGLGAVVGPEAPLIVLGGGLAWLAVQLTKRDMPAQATAVVAAAGSFAAIATLLGSPLTGAFLLMEASGLGGPMAIQVLMPGLLAAGIGSLIFIGLDSLTGYGTFTLAIPNLPPAGGLTGAQFAWAVAGGALAAPVCFGMRWVAFQVRDWVERRPVPFVAVVGLACAGAAILYAETTDHSNADVLFSGETALPRLIEQNAEYSVGALLLLLACKGFAYVGGLSSFRGGPTFPAMFIGAAGGIALSHLPGLPLIPGVAIGIGAMTVGILRLPLTSVLLTTLFLGTDGVTVMPLVIVAVVVCFVLSQFLTAVAPTSAEPATVEVRDRQRAAVDAR